MKFAQRIHSSILAAALATCLIPSALAQAAGSVVTGPPQGENAKPFVAHYYHLAFVVKELEGGKVINSRSYFMSVSSLERQYNGQFTRSIRTGSNIPTDAEGKNYQNVGVNIDCSYILDLPGKVAMNLSADISSLQKEPYDPSKPQATASGALPVVQQNKWNSQVLVPLGKPTVVFSSDELNSRRTMQLELTATEIQ